MNKLVYTDLLHQSMVKNAGRHSMHIKREGRYQSWTYDDFHKDLNRLCSILRRHGLKRGTNAIVIGENSPEWVIAYHSIILTGACTVPVDPNIPAAEIETILSTTQAKVVFCSRIYLSLFRTTKEKYGFPEKIVLLDTKTEEKEPRFDQYILAGNENKEAFSEEFKPDDPMVIIFTSGTTGKAKGAVLCQKNFTAVSRFAVPRMKLGPEDTMCAVLPLHHVFGFAACSAAAFTSGMDVVYVPYIKGPLILEALKEKGVTILPAVPKMISLFYESILHNVKKKGPVVSTVFSGMKTISATAGDTLGVPFRRGLFSSVHKGFGGKLRLIISGGAALSKKYWTGFRLFGFNIVEGYGLTETFGPITLCPIDDPRLGSVGPILDENEIKILEPNDSGIGEVLLRGTCVFKGYYNNESLTADVIDKDGWFHTGDLGRTDKDGFLYIVGRKKDIIVLDSGKNVYPDELEDLYGNSPVIDEIGIFGVNQNDSEIVAAAIVPTKEICKSYTVQQASDLIYEELIRLGKELPVYRRISDFVTIYSPLPRTTTRKLKKMELLKLYNSIKRKSGHHAISEEQLSVIEMALMETEEYKGIVNSVLQLSEKIDQQIINPRSNLEIDLGLDSLKRIELLSIIERNFSITVPEDVFEKMETVGDLVSLVRERNITGEVSVEKILELKDRILTDSFQPVNLPQTESLICRTTANIFQTMASGISGFKVHGIDPLIGNQNPLIFAANHSHALDAFWILNSLPAKLRSNTFFLSEKDNKTSFLLPYVLNKRNMLIPEKDGDAIGLLKIYLAVIRNQKNLIIFPEGPISQPGKLAPFKSGVGLLARETGAAIVPVKIVSSLHLQQTSNTNIAQSRSVIFGKPVFFSDLISSGKCKHDCQAEEISQIVRSAIIEM